jgi:pyrroline-5-carboxylate reductase
MTVLLIGCGRMGGALAKAWVGGDRVLVHDPMAAPLAGADMLASLDPAQVPENAVIVLAVKPQGFAALAPSLAPLAGRLVISIMAGIPMAVLSEAVGGSGRVIRAMPNTPAAIGRGITAALPGADVAAADRARAEALLRAAGDVVWLDHEGDLDAVTAVSGSGPAYFFRVTEALAAAGVEAGLSPDLAMRLARATFTGSAALAGQREDSLAALRTEVTSPDGTTAAGLTALDVGAAIDRLMAEVVQRAARRSRELSAPGAG